MFQPLALLCDGGILLFDPTRWQHGETSAFVIPVGQRQRDASRFNLTGLTFYITSSRPEISYTNESSTKFLPISAEEILD